MKQHNRHPFLSSPRSKSLPRTAQAGKKIQNFSLKCPQQLGLLLGLELVQLLLDDDLPPLEKLCIPLGVELVHNLDAHGVGVVDDLVADVLQVHHLPGWVLAFYLGNLINVLPGYVAGNFT